MAGVNTFQTGYIVRLVYVAIGALVAVHIFGTVGYYILTEGKYSWFDCFYMTFITVATIGFGEIIDMSSNEPARVLTVVIGILGAGNLSLLFSVVTVALLETDLNGNLIFTRFYIFSYIKFCWTLRVFTIAYFFSIYPNIHR